MSTIELLGGSDSLALRIHGRTRPQSRDYWDANWLHCTAEVVTGACRKTVEWQLRNEDLARFLQSLECLKDPGVALLGTLDGWLEVKVSRDENGKIEARCELADESEKSLEFRVELPAGALPKLTSELREILSRFPVIGVQG